MALIGYTGPSTFAGTYITTTTAATSGSTIYYDWKDMSWRPAGDEAPQAPNARELSANERWLNDRVNEMRVKL